MVEVNGTFSLTNCFASGVLALREKTGPSLWQLPPTFGFDADRLAACFDRLPRSTAEAAALARHHDERMTDRALTVSGDDVKVRAPFDAVALAEKLAGQSTMDA